MWLFQDNTLFPDVWGVDIWGCNLNIFLSLGEMMQLCFRCVLLADICSSKMYSSWQVPETEAITFWIHSVLHCWCSDPQITGHKRSDESILSLPHYTLFSFSLCYSCSLTLSFYLSLCCTTPVPLQPPSILLAHITCQFVSFLCFLSILFFTLYPKRSVSFFFHPVSILSSISLSANVCYCVCLAMS